jgi:hypothetical protein
MQDRSERFGVQVMDLRAPVAMRTNQVRIFEDGQVLGDGLTHTKRKHLLAHQGTTRISSAR